MKRSKLSSAAVLIMVAALIFITTGCFAGTGINGGVSNSATTPAVVKPQPRVEKVVATTSGTSSAYYVTLDIKVKNEGAKGAVLVVASVTQNGKTNQNQMEVFLKQGESHELELTFPLVWQGGDFTSNVQALIP